MQVGDIQKQFIESLLLLVRLQSEIKDRFFYEKINNKIFKIAEVFISVFGGERISVAQYESLKISFYIDDIMEIIYELRYLKIVDASPLVLDVERSLLEIKLEIIRLNNKNVLTNKHSKQDVSQNKISEPILNNKVIKRTNKNLNPTKNRILSFIKTYPNKRTKDIVHEFNALSDRTVKRNLTELLHAGFIRKKLNNKAVHYSAIE